MGKKRKSVLAGNGNPNAVNDSPNHCDNCGAETEEFRPYPYLEVICGDDTKYYICDDCYHANAEEI